MVFWSALAVWLFVALVVIHLLGRRREGAHGPVVEHEREAADLPTHAGECPVARGGPLAGYRAGDVRQLDAVGGEVVRADEDFER